MKLQVKSSAYHAKELVDMARAIEGNITNKDWYYHSDKLRICVYDNLNRMEEICEKMRRAVEAETGVDEWMSERFVGLHK